VAVSSATLGDEGCASASAFSASAGACVAPMSDAAMRTGPCDSACRPSTIRIQFIAGAGKTPARVEVADVRLLWRSHAEQLSASDPQSWMRRPARKPWDQTVGPVGAKASPSFIAFVVHLDNRTGDLSTRDHVSSRGPSVSNQVR
jgi:hypothetical protein